MFPLSENPKEWVDYYLIMNEQVRNAVSWWIVKEHNLNRANQDAFVSFFIYYLCLDAILSAESEKDSDTDRLEWLIQTENELKCAFSENAFDKNILLDLKELSPVADMRPHHRKKTVSLVNVDDFAQVVRFVYQIRCNFFHGGKSPSEDRDKALVTYAGKFLKNWIKCLVPCGI